VLCTIVFVAVGLWNMFYNRLLSVLSIVRYRKFILLFCSFPVISWVYLYVIKFLWCVVYVSEFFIVCYKYNIRVPEVAYYFVFYKNVVYVVIFQEL
jgi:hypothetical protein